MVRLRRMSQPVIRICRGGAHNPSAFRHCRRQKKLTLASRQCPRLAFESTSHLAEFLVIQLWQRRGVTASHWSRQWPARFAIAPARCSVAFRKEFRGIEPQREAAGSRGPASHEPAVLPVFGFLRWQQAVLSSAPSEPPGRIACAIDTACIDRLGSSANGDVRGPGGSRWFAKRQNAAQRRWIICDDNCWRAC
jgi:hypothetical protein